MFWGGLFLHSYGNIYQVFRSFYNGDHPKKNDILEKKKVKN